MVGTEMLVNQASYAGVELPQGCMYGPCLQCPGARCVQEQKRRDKEMKMLLAEKQEELDR